MFVPEQGFADAARSKIRNEAQGKIDGARAHGTAKALGRNRGNFEPHLRRGLRDPRKQRRQEVQLGHVRHGHPERSLGRAGVKARALLQRLTDDREGLRQRTIQFPRCVRRHHSRRRSHEQRIVQQFPQAPQRVADGRLRETQPLGGGGEALQFVDRDKNVKELEVSGRDGGFQRFTSTSPGPGEFDACRLDERGRAMGSKELDSA